MVTNFAYDSEGVCKTPIDPDARKAVGPAGECAQAPGEVDERPEQTCGHAGFIKLLNKPPRYCSAHGILDGKRCAMRTFRVKWGI